MTRMSDAPRRKPSLGVILSIIALILVAAGIGHLFAIDPPPTGKPYGLMIGPWEADWSGILGREVDEQGRVDFEMPANDRAKLKQLVAFVAVTDPKSAPARFPTRADQLAYYINAYNALAMDGVIAVGVPDRLTFLRRLSFFVARRVRVGGHSTSLYALENSVIRPLGDPRVHFGLNCMTVSCPRLPRVAFSGAVVDAQLDQAARRFVNDDVYVHVDDQRNEAVVSSIFKFYTKDFLAQAPSLVAYINRYRSTPVPAGYRVVFRDYDWSINDQAKRAGRVQP